MPLNRSQSGVLMAIGIVIMLTVFGGAYFLIARHKKEGPRIPAQALANSLELGGRDPNAPARLPDKNPASPPSPSRAAQSTAPTPKPGPTRSWTIPPEKPEGPDKSEHDIVDLAVNEDGTRALVKSKRAVYFFDLESGRILQTFAPAALRSNQHPGTDSVFLSPDAQFVAIFSESTNRVEGKRVVIQETGTGRAVSNVKVERDLSFIFDWVTFTPSGKILLIPGRIRDKLLVQAISAVDGAGKLITLPGEAQNGSPRLMIPVAGLPEFIIYGLVGKTRDNPSRIWHVDLQGGTEQQVRSISVQPFFLYYDRGVALSPDGRLVLAQDIRKFQLCDWRSDRVLFERVEAQINYTQPHFTPDGKRFVVQRTPLYSMMHFGGPQAGKKESVPVTLELYDVASLKKIAEYAETTRASALAISANGKTIIYARATELYAIDFRAAFGIERLPPMPPPVDADLTVK